MEDNNTAQTTDNTMVKKVLCIWHQGCLDGFGAAWLVLRHFGPDNVELLGGVYNEPPPPAHKLEGRTVFIVDFSYDLQTLSFISQHAEQLILLDHHITACDAITSALQLDNVKGHFSTEHSGALLTWNWFHPNEDAPALIQHISDRDLWRFELAHTREICAALYSYSMDFDTWNELLQRPWVEFLKEGEALEREKQRNIEAAFEKRYIIQMCGYRVPVMNVPHQWASDAGHLMCQRLKTGRKHFSVTYFLDSAGAQVSLRSTEDGLNVGEIAKMFGGGGHKHAAGFRVPCNDNFTMNRLLTPLNQLHPFPPDESEVIQQHVNGEKCK